MLVKVSWQSLITRQPWSRFLSERRAATTRRAGASCHETLPIVVWSDAEPAEKRSPHHLATMKAARFRDRFKTAVAELKFPSSALNAELFDIVRGRDTDLSREDASEVPGAHRGTRRQSLDGQVLLQMLGHPRLQLADLVLVGRLRGRQGAELTLAAGTTKKNHESLGDAKSDGTALSSMSARPRSIPAVTPAEV